MISNRIEYQRIKKNLSQKKICERLGISVKTYYNYVHGNNIPSDVLTKLSEILGCSVDWLLGVTNHTTAVVVDASQQPIAVIGKQQIIEHSDYKVLLTDD